MGDRKFKTSMATVEKDIVKDEFEQLVDNIKQISNLGKKISQSRLNERVLVLLLKDATGLSRTVICKLLDALPELEKRYLKPLKKK